MTDIARSVGGETRLERILELIVKRGRALVDARSILILLGEGDGLSVAATAGEIEGDHEGVRIRGEEGLAGQVMGDGRPARSSSPAESTAGFDALGIEAEAAIAVPLTFRGSVSGVLVAFDRILDGPDFGPEDERLLRAFAASAATAVATAKSVEIERFRHSLEAAEQERKRWARELHDQTLQSLGGLRMLHSAALRSESTSAEELREAIRESIELIDEEIDNLSTLIVELRPAALDQIGLAPALRTLAERRSRQGGIEIDLLMRLDATAGGRLPAELESLVYRLVQEALSNIAKHAEASRAEAVVEAVEEGTGESVAVTVQDDGRGFAPDAETNGFGLVGMRERVELAGGDLRIESKPGEGTTVRARIPVPR